MTRIAGGLAGGGILTAFNVSKSYPLYTGNASFDTTQSFWRTTGKFLAYKPVDTAINFASIYVFTGSWTVAIAVGSASAIFNTGVFYANGVGWDVYDWYQAPSPATDEKRAPTLAMPAPASIAADGKGL